VGHLIRHPSQKRRLSLLELHGERRMGSQKTAGFGDGWHHHRQGGFIFTKLVKNYCYLFYSYLSNKYVGYSHIYSYLAMKLKF
jgi:hypothetical protein